MQMDDTAWGRERNRHSKVYGELVVPFIYLWSEPGLAEYDAMLLTGAVKHGDSVHVVMKKNVNGSMWAFVGKVVIKDGKRYPQKGWVRTSLLRSLGAKEFEAV